MTIRYLKSNQNWYIKFKPTEFGQKVYKAYLDDLLPADKYPEYSRTLEVDSEGYCRKQFHDFQSIFGQFIGMGKENPIEMYFLIEVEDG